HSPAAAIYTLSLHDALPICTAGFLQQRGQFRIGEHQPAAEGDAVGLVGDAAGIKMVEVVEDRVPHQVGMHRRDAVDAVRADKGEDRKSTRLNSSHLGISYAV